MSARGLGMVLILAAGVAGAEVRDEAFVAGDQRVWIDVLAGGEILWVGPNRDERTQVLSGPDIEVVAALTDAAAVETLGARVLVAVQPGSHSCETRGDPRAYSVVTLGERLATDGPLTTCAELTVATVPGAIVLEAEPRGAGEAWFWVPGKGFRATAP